ncbi:hypothetical protein D3C79_940470 [compost metagenome]
MCYHPPGIDAIEDKKMPQSRENLAKMSLNEMRQLPLWRLKELPVWRLAAAISSCPSGLQAGIYKMLANVGSN